MSQTQLLAHAVALARHVDGTARLSKDALNYTVNGIYSALNPGQNTKSGKSGGRPPLRGYIVELAPHWQATAAGSGQVTVLVNDALKQAGLPPLSRAYIATRLSTAGTYERVLELDGGAAVLSVVPAEHAEST